MPKPCSAEMGKSRLHAEAAEVLCLRSELVGIDLVDGEEDGLAGAEEQAREFDVRRGELGAPIDDHDDGLGFVERGARLAEDFGGNQLGVVRNDAAGVDEARGAAGPLDFAVDAVAGDAGLVADDGAPRAGEAIEERGLADVGAAADGEDGLARGCDCAIDWRRWRARGWTRGADRFSGPDCAARDWLAASRSAAEGSMRRAAARAFWR